MKKIADRQVTFETPKHHWPESTPLVGQTPTLPDAEVISLVKKAKAALDAEPRTRGT